MSMATERLTWRLGYKLQQHGVDIAAIDTLPNLLPEIVLVNAGWLADEADNAENNSNLRYALALRAAANQLRNEAYKMDWLMEGGEP